VTRENAPDQHKEGIAAMNRRNGRPAKRPDWLSLRFPQPYGANHRQQRRGGDPVKRILSVAIIALAAGSLGACTQPEERAVGGALIGGAAGAAIGGLATGRAGGALVGGIIGATGGAMIGAATTPRAYCPPRAPYLRYDAYGQPFCSWR
jgi:osmotically inducible lipoprotein OsmB